MAFTHISKDPEEQTAKFTHIAKPEDSPITSDVGRGIMQGILDVGTMASIPAGIASAGVKKFFGNYDLTSNEQEILANRDRETREGSTLDKMNKGETVSIADIMDLSDSDELMPRPSYKNPTMGLIEANAQIQPGGQLQESVRRLTRSAPMALTGLGGFASAAGGDIFGQYAGDTARALGATEGEAQAIDVISSITAPTLLNKVISAAPKALPAMIEREGGLLAKAEILASPQNQQKILSNFEKPQIAEMESRVADISKNTISDIPSFDARKASESLIDGNKNTLLNTVHETPLTADSAWSKVKDHITELYKAEREINANAYQDVRNVASKIIHEPKETINKARSLLGWMESIDTKAPGYAEVEKALITSLRDMSTTSLADQIYTASGGVVAKRESSIQKLMDLNIRLKDIVNYETLTPGIKDRLKPLISSLDSDIRKGLSGHSKEALRLYDTAQNQYATTAKKFGSDAIKQLRKTQSPEEMTSIFSKPSNYEKLKNIVSKDKNIYGITERQVVSNIAQKGTNEAYQSLAEMSNHLSPKARSAAKAIIRSGDKLTSTGQRNLVKIAALEDVQQAFTQGIRPDYTLKAMQTPQGYEIVKSVFNRSPDGQKMFKVLGKQYIGDIAASIVDKNGSINWEKAAKIATDPHTAKIIEEIAGKETLNFFKNLGRYSKNISSNIARFNSSNPGVFEKTLNIADGTYKGEIPTKALIGFLTGTFISPGAAGTYASWEIGKKLFYKALSNPKVQGAIQSLSNPSNYNRKDLENILYEASMSINK